MTYHAGPIDVRGRAIFELRGGRGRPLLYLHSAMGETMWLPFMAALAERRELHVPAHPGFASSQGIDAIRDIEDLVEHYVDYLDAQGWAAVDVVGMSLGGWIGAELAARHPDRVSKLVLCGSVGIWVRERPIKDIFVLDLRYPERLLEMLFYDLNCPAALLIRSMLGPNVPEAMLVDMLNARAATAKIGWNPLLHDPRLERLLPRVTAPTLCLWGDHDVIAPPVYGERFAQLIPGARLEVVAACGHMVPLEKPDAFVAAVSTFVGP